MVIFVVAIVLIRLEWKINFCNIVMSSEDFKILKVNQYHKLDRTLSFVYEDLRLLISNWCM